MARWHKDEAQRSECAPRAATRGGGGAAVLIQQSTNAETK